MQTCISVCCVIKSMSYSILQDSRIIIIILYIAKQADIRHLLPNNKLPRRTTLYQVTEHKALACRPSVQPNIISE